MTNYEVDKTVRVTKSATGNVKRLNAAVVVNNRSVTDAKGKTTQVPLDADEIEKLTALVRESIGFNKERGDSVKVINAPFKVEPVSTTETPFWKSPELIDLVRAAALPAGLALVAVLVFFGLVRPAVKSAFAARPAQLARPGTRIDAVVDDEQAFPPPLAAPAYLRQIEGAKALAKDNPAAVAGIVRGWVGGNEATVTVRTKGIATMALDEAGLEDSAILLMSLGEEEAAARVQAPLAARGAKPRRDDRAHDLGAEGAPRQGARQVHDTVAAAARSSPTPATTCATCSRRRSTRTRPTC